VVQQPRRAGEFPPRRRAVSGGRWNAHNARTSLPTRGIRA
jgi:hypothetical protein